MVPKELGHALATFKADSCQYIEANSHEPQAAKRGRKALAASGVILFYDVKDIQDKVKAKEFSRATSAVSSTGGRIQGQNAKEKFVKHATSTSPC